MLNTSSTSILKTRTLSCAYLAFHCSGAALYAPLLLLAFTFSHIKVFFFLPLSYKLLSRVTFKLSSLFVAVFMVAHFPFQDIISRFIYALLSVVRHFGSIFIPTNSPVSIRSHIQSHYISQSQTMAFPSGYDF